MPCERRVQNIDDFIDPQVGSTHTFNFSQRETINQPGERICLEGVRDSRFCPILVEVGEILNVSGDTVELTAEVLDKAEISINEVEGHRLIPAESGMTKCIDCEQRFVLQENGTLVGSGTFDRTFLRHGPSEGGD